MVNINEVDMGGLTLSVKDIKVGNYGPNGNGFTTKTSAAGGTLTLNSNTHIGKYILLDTAAGSIVTLPAATGTGNIYKFLVTTTVSTNSHIIKVANATDTMVGVVTVVVAGTALAGDIASGTDDTLTMGGTTTGGIAGTWVEALDFAAGKWYIRGVLAGSGTGATSEFSATVNS